MMAYPIFSRRPMIFIGCLAIALFLEYLAAALAYYTLGAVYKGLMLFVMSLLNLLPLLFYLLRQRLLAWGMLLCLLGALVPYQLILGWRWWSLHQEAVQLVPYIYQVKVDTGAYPADLSGYAYGNPALKAALNYRVDNDCNGFDLWYSVGNPGTAHHYSSLYCPTYTYRGWFYIDD